MQAKGRRRVAAELIADLERIYLPKKAADKELTELVAATTLMDFHGIGPVRRTQVASRGSATSAGSPRISSSTCGFVGAVGCSS
jgi:transposase